LLVKKEFDMEKRRQNVEGPGLDQNQQEQRELEVGEQINALAVGGQQARIKLEFDGDATDSEEDVEKQVDPKNDIDVFGNSEGQN
jgi:hypothetical protein